MPTLNEVLAAHSQRISRISQSRDARLRDAADARDRGLRAIPAAAKAYETFDSGVAEARSKQLATDTKAEAARASALNEASDELQEALTDAHRARRDADLAAFAKKRAADDAAEQEFILAIGAGPSKPSSEAQRIRAEKLDKAKKAFDAAMAANQEQFRAARDAALVAESRASREADRAFAAVSRVSESSAAAARGVAERALVKALSAIPACAAEFAAWKTQSAVIAGDFRREEAAAFAQFHKEVQALKT
jgi:hypothetical protein